MLLKFSPYIQALILAMTAYILFTISDVSAKFLGETHPVALVILIPATLAATGLGLRILLQKGMAGFNSPVLKLHILRALNMALISLCCVLAVRSMPIEDFYCIIFLRPLFLILLSRFVFREQVPPFRVGASLLAFAGVLVTVGPHFNTLTIGYAYTLATVFLYGIEVYIVRKMGKQDYAPLYGFYPLLILCLGSLPFAIGDINTPLTPLDYGIFALYGLALLGAQLTLPLSFARAPSVSTVAPLMYSQMVWGILAGIFVFQNSLQMTTLLGGGLIITAGVILLVMERRAIKLIQTENP